MARGIASPKPLEQSHVVVVGGTSGVGLATAIRFAKAGSPRIALVARSPQRGEAACREVQAAGPTSQVLFVSADANNLIQAQASVDRILGAFGTVDVLVCSTTATYVPTLLSNIAPEDVLQIVLDQAAAPLLMSRLFLPAMRAEKRGVIVNVASDAAKVPTPGETVIGAAMAAICMFTRTLAIEAKRDGIRANAVTPSLIANTPGIDRISASAFATKVFAKATERAELGVVEPDEVAATIVFLASPAAAKLTGQVVSVNGGISAG